MNELFSDQNAYGVYYFYNDHFKCSYKRYGLGKATNYNIKYSDIKTYSFTNSDALLYKYFNIELNDGTALHFYISNKKLGEWKDVIEKLITNNPDNWIQVNSCPQCGEELDDESKFCKYCGFKLDVIEETKQQENTHESIVTNENQPEQISIISNEELENSTNRKVVEFTKWLWVVTLIIMILVPIITISLNSSNSKNSNYDNQEINNNVLHKKTVNNYYSEITNGSYLYSDKDGKSISLLLYDKKIGDSSCVFTYKISNKAISEMYISRNCLWSEREETIELDLLMQHTIREPSSNKFIVNENINSLFNGNNKRSNNAVVSIILTIGNNKYELINKEYKDILNRNIKYILINPSNECIYDLNGNSLHDYGAATGDYSLNNIDVSKYTIIERD